MLLPKIGIVVQRYGTEVNGGAEVHARLLATHLAGRYDVNVLTTCALDHQQWQAGYAAGESVVEGIKVIRFANQLRGAKQAHYRRIQKRSALFKKLLTLIGQPKWGETLFKSFFVSEADGLQWLTQQGPAVPALLTYLKEQELAYAAFIVFTALYYPGALSVLTVPRKCIFIPTMHDEKASYFPIYQKVMAAPAWIFFNTKTEQEFSEKLFPINHVQKRVVGIGVDLKKEHIRKDASVLADAGITQPYLIYIGRIDSAKGCDILIRYFIRYLTETGAALQLVLVGKGDMPYQKHPAVIPVGFVTDATKDQLLLQAQTLVMPSLYESLSMVLLESFACGIPVIANGKTEVLKEHIVASGGGWCFSGYAGFKKAVMAATQPAINREKGEAGYRYVQQYSWEKVLNHFDEAIAAIAAETKP